MDFVTTQTYLGDILRIVSDAMLGPAIVLLLGFIVYAAFCIGSIIVEIFAEHRNFKVHMPRFLAELADAKQEDMPGVIEESGLLNRQKLALLTVFDYRTLPGDMLVALVKRLLNEEDTHYQRIINRNNVAVRVAPMLGLMGTLIPLGPGIAALGQGDVAALSSSLVIAFNTTVAGLAAAAVCLVIARIRRTWYNTYMNALESAMASMLYKTGMLQDAGEISVERPSDHAILFKRALKRKSGNGLPVPSDKPEGMPPQAAQEQREDQRAQELPVAECAKAVPAVCQQVSQVQQGIESLQAPQAVQAPQAQAVQAPQAMQVKPAQQPMSIQQVQNSVPVQQAVAAHQVRQAQQPSAAQQASQVQLTPQVQAAQPIRQVQPMSQAQAAPLVKQAQITPQVQAAIAQGATPAVYAVPAATAQPAASNPDSCRVQPVVGHAAVEAPNELRGDAR